MAEEKTKIRFYPLDVDYDRKGTILVYGRTEQGKRIIIRDWSFHFYFWILADDLVDIQKRLEYVDLEHPSYNVLKTEVFRKRFFDKDVTALKVFVNHPAAVKLVKQEFPDVSFKETDISLGKKYLIDKGITPLLLCEAEGYLSHVKSVEVLDHASVHPYEEEQIIPSLRLLSVDIEVYGKAFGEEKALHDPIISIALYGEKFQKVLTWKDFKNKQDFVEIVTSEEEMLQRFVELFHTYNPDYVLGYFSDGFDFPYLKARAERLHVKLPLGIDRSGLIVRRGINGKAKITGVSHIDVLKFIRTIMGGSLQLDAYDLNTVAYELLQEEKKDLDWEGINAAWEEGDLHDLCAYNLHDAYLTLELFKKIEQNFHELVRLIGITPFEICRLSYGQLVENYLIKRASEFNEIIQRRPYNDEIMERRMVTYQGGFVMEPVPGLYEDVVMLDFRSLYPSIIIAKNISPSMLQEKKGHAIEVNGNTYHFNNEHEAFIPAIIKEIILRRNRIKELLKKQKQDPILEARSYALKILANSAYGMFGFFGARYYSKECAESITAFGRQYIQETIGKAEKKGFKVIYSDTDSIALHLRDKKKEDVFDFLKNINKDLPEFMELEFENYYLRGIFVSKKGETQGAKKKYALIDEENKLKIRGFETVRKDWSLIARETQYAVLEKILQEGDYTNALAYVKKVIEDIRNKKVINKKMVILTQLKMDLDDYKQIGPHVAVAQKMRAKGHDVPAGSMIHFIIAEGKGKIRDKAVLPEDCNDKMYDAVYYVENQILPSVGKIFEVFGVNSQELLLGEQKSLGDF